MKKRGRLAPSLREPTSVLTSIRYEPRSVYVRYFGWPRDDDDTGEVTLLLGLATR
jgi:hypothetical protein